MADRTDLKNLHVWINFLSFSIGFAGFLFSGISFLEDYLKFKTNIQVTITDRDQMNFPAISFCDVSRVHTSKLCRVDPKMCSLFSRYDILVPTKNNSGREAEGQNELDQIEEQIKTEFLRYDRPTLESLSITKNELVKSCKFAWKDCMYNITTYFDADYSNCFAFNVYWGTNHSDPTRNKPSKSEQTLELILDLHTKEYAPIIDTKAALIAVHDPYNLANVAVEGVSIQPGFITEYDIEQTSYQYLEEPYDTNCQRYPPFDTGEPGIFIPTQSQCQARCTHKLMMESCGCTQRWHWLTFGGSPCNSSRVYCARRISETRSTIRKCQDECRTPCRQDLFKFGTIGLIKWPAESEDLVRVRLNHFDFKYAQENFVRLRVNFKGSTRMIMEYTPAGTLVTFLASLGGYLGLWLGTSIATLYDSLISGLKFFQSLFLLILAKLLPMKTKKRRNKNNLSKSLKQQKEPTRSQAMFNGSYQPISAKNRPRKPIMAHLITDTQQNEYTDKSQYLWHLS